MGHYEFYAEADNVAYHNFGKHDNKTIQEHFHESCRNTGGSIVLVTDIVHSYKQGRNQGDDHKTHDTFRIYGIVNGHSRPAGSVGDEGKGFETVKDTAESMKLPAFFNMWPDFIKKFFYHIFFFQVDSIIALWLIWENGFPIPVLCN